MHGLKLVLRGRIAQDLQLWVRHHHCFVVVLAETKAMGVNTDR